MVYHVLTILHIVDLCHAQTPSSVVFANSFWQWFHLGQLYTNARLHRIISLVHDAQRAESVIDTGQNEVVCAEVKESAPSKEEGSFVHLVLLLNETACSKHSFCVLFV